MQKFLLKKALVSLIKRKNKAKKIIDETKNEEIKKKNELILKKKLISSINELKDFFDIEGDLEELSNEDLERYLDMMIKSISEEYKIKIE